MQITQGYKQTEVGMIPQDWEVHKIKDFTSIVTGATPSTQVKEFWGGNIAWMASGELNNKIIVSVQGRITQAGYNATSTHMVPPYCVLIGLAGQGKTRGTAAYNLIPLCTNQSIASILPQNSYNSKYLFYFMDSQYDNLRLLSSGDGGRGGLNLNLLYNIQIPFPPIEEQKRIAEALSEMDELIAGLDEQIAKKRQIKEGAMQQLLTGKTRLPDFSQPWHEYELGELLAYEQPTKYLVSSTEYVDKGTPVLTAGKTFILGYTNEEWGIYNTLPVIIFDDFVTESKFVDFPFKAKSSAMKMLSLRNKSNNLRLIYEIMQLIDFPMTDHKRYWIAEYSKIKIMLPEYDEQNAIAQILSDMDDEIRQLEAERDKYTLVKQGMMQELLTGKTRLV